MYVEFDGRKCLRRDEQAQSKAASRSVGWRAAAARARACEMPKDTRVDSMLLRVGCGVCEASMPAEIGGKLEDKKTRDSHGRAMPTGSGKDARDGDSDTRSSKCPISVR